MPKEDKDGQRRFRSKQAASLESTEAPPLLTSAALIGIGALIEPELLAGMAVGAGIVLASRFFPNIVGNVLRPIAKNAVRAGYAAAARTREVVAEVSEEIEDIMAEARSRQESPEHLH